MDFTREPVVETIITPREGYRLVVRSSKSMGQEEHFVDALEVVSFANACFFRSIERPKPFLVPCTDYEVLEVREQRLALKAKMPEGSVKIGATNGRNKEPKQIEEPVSQEAKKETDLMKGGRRDRRQKFRRRDRIGKAPEVAAEGEMAQDEFVPPPEMYPESGHEPVAERHVSKKGEVAEEAPAVFRTMLPPPSKLIREDLQRYRENTEFKGAFYESESEVGPSLMQETISDKEVPLPEEEPFWDVAEHEEAPPKDIAPQELKGAIPEEPPNDFGPEQHPEELPNEFGPEQLPQALPTEFRSEQLPEDFGRQELPNISGAEEPPKEPGKEELNQIP